MIQMWKQWLNQQNRVLISKKEQYGNWFYLFQKKENGTWTRINSAEDISSMTLILTAEAEMEGYSPVKVTQRLIDKVEVPK